MRCLNSPATLNVLEADIVAAVPEDARHILVVNSGDGRLPRALRDKFGSRAALSVVTVHPGLAKHLADFAAPGTNPWDFEWHRAKVAEYGPYDCLILYQLQEFWRGELHGLQELLAAAKPGAMVWISFVNAQSRRMSERFLPTARLGFAALGDPMRNAAAVDYASMIDFVFKTGGTVVQVWGLLDGDAQKYCREQLGQSATWDVMGLKVPIGTLADAFLWGAAVVAIRFELPGGSVSGGTPKVSYVPYDATLFQWLTQPYPDEQLRESILCAAQFEVAAWRRQPMEEPGQLAQFLIQHLENREIKQRVLFAGIGWGRDLLIMKRTVATWDWVGTTSDRRLLDLARDLLDSAEAIVVVAERDVALPFDDDAFDVGLSLGAFSLLYEPAARHLADEMRRVVKGPIYHLEDGRGPEHDICLKLRSLSSVYSRLGCESVVQQVAIDGRPSGMYFAKITRSS